MIRPRQLPGKPGFLVTYRHPDMHFRHPCKERGPKLVSAGLQTTVQLEAEAYARDLDRLCNAPDDWQDVRRCIAKYERVVLGAFFGRDHPALNGLPERPTLIPKDAKKLNRRILMALDRARPKNPVSSDSKSMAALGEALEFYESERFKELQEERDNALRLLKEAEAKIADLNEDLARLRRAQNAHVKVRMGAVWDTYKGSSEYTALSVKTQNEIAAAAESLIESLPEKDRCKLADLRAGHVDKWIDELKPKAADATKPLSPVTKAKVKRYASVFLGWAYRRFDLFENPMNKTGSVKGAALTREEVIAIEREEDMVEMLKTLKGIDPYWHALRIARSMALPQRSSG